MMACIFCKEKSDTIKKFNGHKLYGDADIREDIMQLFSVQPKQYLKKNISVCKKCISTIHLTLDLKQGLWNNSYNNQDQPVTIWCTSRMEEEEREKEKKRQKRQGSRSHSGENRPPSSITELDMIWKRASPSTSNRNRTPKSRPSRSTRSKSRRPSSATPPRTRSVSRLRETLFWCEHCDASFDDLDRFTHHLVNHHGFLPLHFCDECNFRYTSQEHLRYHEKHIHDTSPFFCIICKMMTKNTEELQEHLQEHLTYKNSSCNYCDLLFLTGQQLETHVRNDHKSKKKRKRKGYIYVEQFDSLPNNNVITKSSVNIDEKVFEVRVLNLRKDKEKDAMNSTATQFQQYPNSKNRLPSIDKSLQESTSRVYERRRNRAKSQIVECTSTTDTITSASNSKNVEAGSQSSECSSSTDAAMIETRSDLKSFTSEHCSSTNTITMESNDLGKHDEREVGLNEVSSSPTLDKDKQKLLLQRTISVSMINFGQIMS